VGFPFDIQQMGAIPISTVLRAATRIVTLYMLDVVLVWFGLLYCSVFYNKSHWVTAIF